MTKYVPAVWECMSRYIEYLPKEGELKWKVRTNSRCKLGKVVGYKEVVGGYRHFLFKRVRYFVHRIIWMIETNQTVPDDRIIDHKDGNTDNNRFSNLRIATSSQNNSNRVKVSTRNISGFPWVYRTEDGRYRARVHSNGDTLSKRGFRNPVEAYCYARKIARELFGDFLPVHNLGSQARLEYGWFLTMLKLAGTEQERLDRFHRSWLCWHYAD